MTIEGNKGVAGYRTPCIHCNPLFGLQVVTTIGSNPDASTRINPPPPVGQWTTIAVSQLKNGPSTTFSVKINGTTLWTLKNPTPLEFPSVKVFVSDPWHPAQAGSIRGLTIKTQ